MVVGGGVIGTMHALLGVERGWSVVHLEREDAPRGASVRNFGLVWVSGRARGREIGLALEARELWESLAGRYPGTGFRANGSLTVAATREEEAVLEEVAARDDAATRGIRMLAPDQVRELNPALGKVRSALHCAKDAAVEPRRVLGALREACLASGRYQWLAGREVVEIGDHEVLDSAGERHPGDLVVLCTGAAHRGLVGQVLDGAPLRRVRLQMMETARYRPTVTTSLADGDSLRYYPGFDVPARAALQPQSATAAAWSVQLVTGFGGRGMTLSPVVATETFR